MGKQAGCEQQVLLEVSAGEVLEPARTLSQAALTLWALLPNILPCLHEKYPALGLKC